MPYNKTHTKKNIEDKWTKKQKIKFILGTNNDSKHKLIFNS